MFIGPQEEHVISFTAAVLNYFLIYCHLQLVVFVLTLGGHNSWKIGWLNKKNAILYP